MESLISSFCSSANKEDKYLLYKEYQFVRSTPLYGSLSIYFNPIPIYYNFVSVINYGYYLIQCTMP